MCNLYSETKGQAAIRALFRTAHDRTGNLLAFPDQLAPIVRNGADDEREMVMARWGMSGPLQFGGQPVTKIRNVASPHLARLAFAKEPLPRASDIVLRIRRHEAVQDADMVRAGRGWLGFGRVRRSGG